MRFHYWLFKALRNMFRKKVKPKYKKMNYNELMTLIRKFFGEETKFVLLDYSYRYTDISSWVKIIKLDELNEYLQYKVDVLDCDNFATVFLAHVNEFFDMNAVAVCLGRVYDDQNNFLGYHAYNCLICDYFGDDVLLIYEPQSDWLTFASRRAKVGNYYYETDLVVFL